MIHGGGDLTRRGLIGAAAAACTRPALSAAPAVGLRQLADSKGLLWGTCLNAEWLPDPKLISAIAADCNILIPEVGLNMTRVQPRPGASLDFSQAESVYAICRSLSESMRGHNLVWHTSTPAWVAEVLKGQPASGVEKLLKAYVRGASSHWAGRLIHQEVVNEPVSGDGLVPFALNRGIGERYIDVAFDAAKEADPSTPLWINQDWIEMDSIEHRRRRVKFLLLLERLRHRNVPIDGVGIEGHLLLEHRFSEKVYADLLKDIGGMGFKIIISEFDIHDRGVAGSVSQRDAAVAALGKAFLDVSLDSEHCVGLLDWGHADRLNWLRQTPDKQRSDKAPLRPAPLDDQLHRKPLWYAMKAALRATPDRRGWGNRAGAPASPS
jgi:endo-1,4-beta-xylanase